MTPYQIVGLIMMGMFVAALVGFGVVLHGWKKSVAVWLGAVCLAAWVLVSGLLIEGVIP